MNYENNSHLADGLVNLSCCYN